jgi:acyl carrier protein
MPTTSRSTSVSKGDSPIFADTKTGTVPVPSRDCVLEDVKRVLSELLSIPRAEINESQTLLGDLAMDSLEIVECSMEIEEHFEITVPDELMEHAKTVGHVVDGVLMLLAKTPATG